MASAFIKLCAVCNHLLCWLYEQFTQQKTAASATLHCLTGCAVGEVTGMVLTTGCGWSNTLNVIASIATMELADNGFILRYQASFKPA